MSDTPRTDEIAIQMQPPVDAETAFHFMDCHARQLERELAKVTKQRDVLVNAIRKHKEITATILCYCDEELYKALEELEQGGAA